MTKLKKDSDLPNVAEVIERRDSILRQIFENDQADRAALALMRRRKSRGNLLQVEDERERRAQALAHGTTVAEEDAPPNLVAFQLRGEELRRALDICDRELYLERQKVAPQIAAQLDGEQCADIAALLKQIDGLIAIYDRMEARKRLVSQLTCIDASKELALWTVQVNPRGVEALRNDIVEWRPIAVSYLKEGK